ncbi:MAG: nicotinate-nucleotide adenylyltransferase [Pseudomonadota bacterium]
MVSFPGSPDASSPKRDLFSAPKRHATDRIGLLGGSFNPAHGGHREISLEALSVLGLDAVWWLVTPGNPLKDPGLYAPYEDRLATARTVADHHRIVVSDFEHRKGLQYTHETLAALTDLWQQIEFVWLMGADSLETFHLWRNWQDIFATVPIAVFNRPGSERAATESTAAREFSAFKVDHDNAMAIFTREPPVWTFIGTTQNPTSSTDIRNQRR